MRIFVIALVLLYSVSINSQAKVNTPIVLVEVNDLSIGESFVFGDYEIKFLDVKSDSRCPKNVMCIWAGEAIAIVAIYKSGNRISEKTLTFTPTLYLPNNKGNLYITDVLKITGIELVPYPKPETKILKENYRLKLLIEEVVE